MKKPADGEGEKKKSGSRKRGGRVFSHFRKDPGKGKGAGHRKGGGTVGTPKKIEKT